MLNLVSLFIGLGTLILALVAFVPLLGWANWLIIPLAIIGAGLGMVSASKGGRNLNLFVIAVGVVRADLCAAVVDERVPGWLPDDGPRHGVLTVVRRLG